MNNPKSQTVLLPPLRRPQLPGILSLSECLHDLIPNHTLQHLNILRFIITVSYRELLEAPGEERERSCDDVTLEKYFLKN